MKTQTPYLIAVLILIFSINSPAQINVEKHKILHKSLTVSYGFMVPIFGPNNAMVQNLKENNFDAYESSGTYFNTYQKSFPIKRNKPGKYFKLEYYLFNGNAIQFIYYRPQNAIIEGFKRKNTNGVLRNFHYEIESITDVYGINYSVNSKDYRHQFRFGPAIAIHRVNDLHPAFNNQERILAKMIPSLNAGYSCKIVNKKLFFVQLNADLLISQSSQAPGGVVFESYSFYSPYANYETTYIQGKQINMSSLMLGIDMGLNIR